MKESHRAVSWEMFVMYSILTIIYACPGCPRLRLQVLWDGLIIKRISNYFIFSQKVLNFLWKLCCLVAQTRW